jgi:hypothetical protein
MRRVATEAGTHRYSVGMAKKPEPTKPTLWDIYLAVGVGKAGLVGLLLGGLRERGHREGGRTVQQASNEADGGAAAMMEQRFDARIGLPELHLVARRVSFVERPTILPPDVFRRFGNRCFWRGQQSNPRNVRVLVPDKLRTECQSDVRTVGRMTLQHKGNSVVTDSGAS